MSDCYSDCDCDTLPHEPDCSSHVICYEGGYCDRHYLEAMKEHAWLRGLPRHAVFDDAQAREEREQELRDAGRWVDLP
jgi:hypothetical protein